jgi:hypothetical protein
MNEPSKTRGKYSYEPLVGWGNRYADDTDCLIVLRSDNPLVQIQALPKVCENTRESCLWWSPNAEKIGISSGNNVVWWNRKEVGGYVVDIQYPARFGGACGFGVTSAPVEQGVRLDKFICITMPYSSASLEKLIQICSVLSRIAPLPVRSVQWADT